MIFNTSQQSFVVSIFLIPALFLVAACSGTKQITVHENESPIEIDGSLSQWNTSSTLLKEDDDIRYFATVHGDYLYLFVDVRGIFKDRMIRQYGMTVYVGNSEDTRRSVGIGYPAGTFNLLRQYSNAYNDFLTDIEWSGKPESVDLIESLNEQLFDHVMVVERFDGSSPEYGFVDMNQIQIDGFELATDHDRRLLSLEMKIPIDGSSLYNVGRENLWVGFSIEPPTFRFREDNDYSPQRNRQGYGGYGGYGQQRPRQSTRRGPPRSEDWFILRLQ